MQNLARSQDIIGWDLYMMGMLSKQMAAVQSTYLLQHQSARPVLKWLSGLITQLLQVTHCQWIYRCVLVHDKSGIDEGDRAPAGLGRRGAGGRRHVPTGMQFRRIGNNEWRTAGILDSGHSGGKGGMPPLGHGTRLVTALRARNHGHVRAIIECTTINAYARHHLVWAEQFPGIRHPGRREPSLRGSDCNAVSHPCLRRIMTPIG
mgnify:CR=1 FL=1